MCLTKRFHQWSCFQQWLSGINAQFAKKIGRSCLSKRVALYGSLASMLQIVHIFNFFYRIVYHIWKVIEISKSYFLGWSIYRDMLKSWALTNAYLVVLLMLNCYSSCSPFYSFSSFLSFDSLRVHLHRLLLSLDWVEVSMAAFSMDFMADLDL